jgi:hypothetical protein
MANIKKRVLNITLWTSAVAIVLFATLVIHIAMVIPPTKQVNDTRNRQLSRIDFKQDLSPTQADKIKGFIGAMEGVEGVHYNPESKILVYIHSTEKVNPNTVYNKVVKMNNYKAERYVVKAAEIKGGCTAGMGKEKSLTVKMAQVVSNIIH